MPTFSFPTLIHFGPGVSLQFAVAHGLQVHRLVYKYGEFDEQDGR